MNKENQKAWRRIWTLYHPSDLIEEEDTEDNVIMSMGAITAEGGREEDYRSDDQSYQASEELFFAAPDYKDIRLCEEPDVHEYWNSGLTVESLEALR